MAKSSDEKHPAKRTAPKTGLGLALGGGGARGMAHITMLEVFDELGVRPGFVAGTSIGAIFGAAYASGMSGAEIRTYTEELFANRTGLIKRIAGKWPGALTDLWNPFTPALFNADTLMEILLPDQIPARFERLKTPFAAIATDYTTHEQVILADGDLIPAIAASCALPMLLQPIRHGKAILIDGGFVNPLPYDIVQEKASFTVAIDVNGHPRGDSETMPNSMETVLGMTQIILGSLVREKLRWSRPDILIRPHVGQFRVLDFFKYSDIIAAAEPDRDILKRELETHLEKLQIPAES